MKLVLITMAAAGVFAANTVAASEKIANANGCMACHAIDKKLIGPGFKDVAAKHKGDKDAETKLAQKIKAGGSGVWGSMPMPPQTHIKDDDIKSLAHWVMTLK